MKEMIPVFGLIFGFLAFGASVKVKNELLSNILVVVGNALVTFCAMLMLKRDDNAILTYYYGFFVGAIIMTIDLILAWIKDDDNWWRFK